MSRNNWLLLTVMVAICFSSEKASASQLDSYVSPQKQIVWQWKKNRCDVKDTVDAPAQGFRTKDGLVTLFASEPTAHPFSGKSLSSLQPSCDVGFSSTHDPVPDHFADLSWLSGFYTGDGVNVFAIAHTEYHGWTFWGKDAPGCKNNKLCVELTTPECDRPQTNNARSKNACWYNAITSAVSTDSGRHFVTPNPPKNFVAGLPLKYGRSLWNKANGYWSPTNIIKSGNFYYAMVNVWTVSLPEFRQPGGTCVIRSSTLTAGAMWSAWDGSSFSVPMRSPYTTNADPTQVRPCKPLKYVYAPTSLNTIDGHFLILEYATDDRFGGQAGLYASLSDDIVNWSKPSLVVSEDQLRKMDDLYPVKGDKTFPWSYGYFSLLDDSSAGYQLYNVGKSSSLFYIRFDMSNPPYDRALVRRAVKIELR